MTKEDFYKVLEALQIGPNQVIGYGEQQNNIFAFGWNSAKTDTYNRLMQIPAFKEYIAGLDAEMRDEFEEQPPADYHYQDDDSDLRHAPDDYSAHNRESGNFCG